MSFEIEVGSIRGYNSEHINMIYLTGNADSVWGARFHTNSYQYEHVLYSHSFENAKKTKNKKQNKETKKKRHENTAGDGKKTPRKSYGLKSKLYKWLWWMHEPCYIHISFRERFQISVWYLFKTWKGSERRTLQQFYWSSYVYLQKGSIVAAVSSEQILFNFRFCLVSSSNTAYTVTYR